MPAVWNAPPSLETTTRTCRGHHPRCPALLGKSPNHTQQWDHYTLFKSALTLSIRGIRPNQYKQPWLVSCIQYKLVLSSQTLMLFLYWYPGLFEPLRSSSLKMTICSNRKTLRSLLRDKTPPSCSQTQKVSCCSSFPWDVNFPWTTCRQVSTGSSINWCLCALEVAELHKKHKQTWSTLNL